MAYLKRISLALSLTAMAGVASPALAETQLSNLELTDNVLTEVEVAPAAVAEPVEVEPVGAAETVQLEAVETPPSEASLLALPEEAPITSNNLFTAGDIESALLAATVEAAPEATDSIDLAQATPTTVSVSPNYLGVGGNIGIGNRSDSALSSFGFNIISKISLGPRFSVRPGATITNDRSGFTIPVTYNFNTISYSGFLAQPYAGIGVEIPTSGDIGLLVNAGADIPISSNFTLNAVSNFRVTSGFALGISLGVAYNFPFFFD
ncbi:hypothetical protein IQ265_20630 [Nodosilinea sp. LEGE 06152]|uniref:hypothetical protein n=1 Tax=Nodosilinea sp. LEGE 06152 TaxID=2777966 RepID=UPI0018829629|nr:hypothetical protein [Nodosilinea sp. LEGE 06152]MBE9159222.1 hypothetical protein [Nodosilinea sp. LEGE 06152]